MQAREALAQEGPARLEWAMLHLHSQTDPGWAAALTGHLADLLVDHAHLEKKAASMAITLLFRYPLDAGLQRPLSGLAQEELAHYAQVLDLVEARGEVLAVQVPAPYAAALLGEVRRMEPARQLDTLLCCALIEARSCERMGLLAQALPPGSERELYADLWVTEARHHVLYTDLARARFSQKEVEARLARLAAHEAEVLAAAPPMARMHAAAP